MECTVECFHDVSRFLRRHSHQRKEWLAQLDTLFLQCFHAHWEHNPMHVIVAYHADSTLLGVLFYTPTLFPNTYIEDRKVYEIYNVAVSAQYRRQGVLTRMLNALPTQFYYMLSVRFRNRPAYTAYLSSFFHHHLSIGWMSRSNEVGFVLGGYPGYTEKCQSIELLDTLQQRIHRHSLNMQQLFRESQSYTNLYVFIQRFYKEIQQMVQNGEFDLLKELLRRQHFRTSWVSRVRSILESRTRHLFDVIQDTSLFSLMYHHLHTYHPTVSSISRRASRSKE